jgi:hypothetical protein
MEIAMKESDLHSKALQTLKEFESMEDIQPSADWNVSMMARISSAKINPVPGSTVPRVALVLLVVILANLGIILSAISNNSRQSFNRGTQLQTISKEFLINPTSISQ